MSVLQINNLKVSFSTPKGEVNAVNGATFTLHEGKTLALVGESGSGKSVSAMSILRLLDQGGKIKSGEILFTDGDKIQDLTKLTSEEMRRVRGNKISVVFQEPMTALNPVLSIGKQLSEPFRIHQNCTKKQALARALTALNEVRITGAERVLKAYPHQLSGGMRQRVMIAMALSCKPKILIADEPTTALDVTIQAQILQLMRTLQKENGTAILFITHDLGIVKEMADDVAVMYCGQVVERVPAPVLFRKSGYSHPYTEGLLKSLPSAKNKEKRLYCIPGGVPHPLRLPKGCKFAPRCPYATQRCVEEEPGLEEKRKGQFVRCFYADKQERNDEEHHARTIR